MLSVSHTDFTLICLVALYAPVSFVGFKWLMPRLTSNCRRLAIGWLLAQLAVIFIALTIEPASGFEARLWAFHSVDANDSEWNIPATLASTQFALVGGIALLTAWRAKAHAAWLRVYFACIGLVFLGFALDEYFVLHESWTGWQIYYSLLGAALAAATRLAAWRSSRATWTWHGCFLAGLAMSAVGAIVFDVYPQTCDGVAFFRFEGCLEFSFQEEALEFLGIWLTLVAMLGHFCAAIPSPSRLTRRLMAALPVFWIALLLLNALLPRLELRFAANRASAEVASGVRLLGYSIHHDARHVSARLYARARQADYIGLGYSLHLVDQVSGDSIVGVDAWADRQHGIWLLGPDYAPIYRQTMGLTIPSDAPKDRALSMVLSLWRRGSGGFERETIVAGDAPLLSETQLALGEMVLPIKSSAPATEPLANFQHGFVLESFEMPDAAVAGESLPISFAWRSDVESDEEIIQFLHLGPDESGEWFVHDQPPLGARLPTRLWYTGLRDSQTWTVPLPDDLASGTYGVFTGLYRASDRERLPATDAHGAAWSDARVALGSVEIEAGK